MCSAENVLAVTGRGIAYARWWWWWYDDKGKIRQGTLLWACADGTRKKSWKLGNRIAESAIKKWQNHSVIM